VAKRLLETTDRGFRLAVSDSWLAGLFRTKIVARIAAFAMQFERMQRLAFRAVSQTAIAYRNSALAKTLGGLPESAPHAGDRFPWLKLKLGAGGPAEDLFEKFDDLGFDLFVFGQSLPAGAVEFGALVRARVVPSDPANDAALAQAGIPQPSFYLVRPDGYIGLCGGRFDAAAVKRYLDETLRGV
jgi:hypothetical protein